MEYSDPANRFFVIGSSLRGQQDGPQCFNLAFNHCRMSASVPAKLRVRRDVALCPTLAQAHGRPKGFNEIFRQVQCMMELRGVNALGCFGEEQPKGFH